MESTNARQTKNDNYRPDVDGLRAVAVLLVVAFHLNTRVTAGFIGVDVFFVISGYLISSVILSEMASGTFSIANFYERRIRRIFPALFVVLVAIWVIGYFTFSPIELRMFATSTLTAIFSVSNILLRNHSTYFFTPEPYLPLLHTWSLAVEEQFYIFFPLFLLAIHRWIPQRLKAAIWSVSLITFALASYWVLQRDPPTAFFLAPFRAWELLMGTIVSQRYLPAIEGAWKRNCATATGLLLILGPAFFYPRFTTPFPGLAALPPCLGAALIIAGGETGDSYIGRLLSWRPVVFIGLISYSLYLWHWPIIVFLEQRYILSPASLKPIKVVVFVTSLLAAALSWYFVEQPIRKGPYRPNRRALFLASGVAVAALSAFAAFTIAEQGFPSRLPAALNQIDRYSDFDASQAIRENDCFIAPPSARGGLTGLNKAACLTDVPGQTNFLLIGDSHAAHLYIGIKEVFPGLNLSYASTGACASLLTPPQSSNRFCADTWHYIFGDYLIHHTIDTVLIASRWSASNLPELERTVKWVQERGMRAIVVGPGIEFDVTLPRLLLVAARLGKPNLVEEHRVADLAELDQQMSRLAREWNVPYISIYENLCHADGGAAPASHPISLSSCPSVAPDGAPLLFDRDHFTPEAAVWFVRTMKDRHQFP